MPPSIRAFAIVDLVPVARPLARGQVSGRWRRRLLRRLSGRIGLTCVVIALGMAIAGPALAPHDPSAISGGSLTAPSRMHLMGTDALGRDVLSAVLLGARTSWLVASAVSVVALLLGTVVGMIAGYRGGWIDDVLMRATEIAQVIPRFFVAVIAIALFGPGLDRLVVTLGLTSWPSIARLVRGEVMATRALDFIRASEAMGATTTHVIVHQLFPNVLPSIIVALGLMFGQVLLLEATLGFLGLGDPSAMSWGSLAAQAQGFLRVAWWLALFPGLAITLSVLGVNLLADALASSDGA